MANVLLYNTLSRKKEAFTPLHPPKVGMYTCGPTVYNYAHIGNLRSYIFADLLRRVLAYNGYDVTQVMNITDVGHLTSDADEGEDKMEKGSRREGKSVWQVAQFFTEAFKRDIASLNILEPSIWCKATEHIPEQIRMVKTLVGKRLTYDTKDAIYFDTTKIADYGKLARLKTAELKEGARVDIGEKRSKTDFALWKFSPKDQQRQMEWWFSGPLEGRLVTDENRESNPEYKHNIGFPGWHIECSAMSSKYLGEQFDIHTGGIDHISVHHTNEIAQAEAAFGKKPWVRYWLHGEFLVIDEGKMAKSGENFLTLSVLEEKGYDPMDYRYLCLTAHYRQQLKFSWEAMESAKQSRARLMNVVGDLRAAAEGTKPGCADYLTRFQKAIDDDLNIPQALAVLWELLRDQELPPEARLTSVEEMDRVLGLRLLEEEKIEIPAEIAVLAEKREAARKKKDFKESDRLREELKAKGWQVDDQKEGYRIKKKV